jgi:hypothetical protein
VANIEIVTNRQSAGSILIESFPEKRQVVQRTAGIYDIVDGKNMDMQADIILELAT